MEFRNLTPFSVMEYAMDDKLDERHRVVAMKTGFRLMQDAEGLWQTQLMENPPLPLCVEDEYSGEINRSPVLRESDLAPRNLPAISSSMARLIHQEALLCRR